jgi:hypothetical protein
MMNTLSIKTGHNYTLVVNDDHFIDYTDHIFYNMLNPAINSKIWACRYVVMEATKYSSVQLRNKH